MSHLLRCHIAAVQWFYQRPAEDVRLVEWAQSLG